LCQAKPQRLTPSFHLNLISFVSVFPPFRGGISKFSHYLYQSLKTRTDIEAFNFSRLYPNIIFPGQSQELPTGRRKNNYATPLLHSYNPFNWRKSGKVLANHTTDVVIYSYWHPFFALSYLSMLKGLKKRRPNTAVIAIAHNIYPHEYFPFQTALLNKLFAQTDSVILLSDQTEQDCRKMGLKTSTRKLFHPVYEESFPTENKEKLRERYGFEKDELVVLFFGLVRSYKGLDIFIDALNELNLKKMKIRPFIVGEFYADKQLLIDRMDPSKMDQMKIIDRFVTDQEAAEVMSLSDLMVLPYKKASQSGALAQSINFHLPAIITNLPGLTEYIDHGKEGYVIPPNDSEALKKVILDFWQSDKKEEMVNNVAQRKKQLSWERFADRLFENIRQLQSGKG